MNNGPDYVAKYLFDNQGRTVLAVAPNGDTTETTYGVEGQPTQVRYPDRLTTLMDYNLLGEPTQRIRTGTGSGLAFGTHSDTLTWERDALGRETRTRVAGDPRMDRTTIWDKHGTRRYAGLPVRMELGTGLWTEYDYDSRLRLTERRQGGTLLGHNMADTQTVQWRTDGQRSSLRTMGAQWNWTYDNLARLQKHTLTDPAGTNHTLLDSTTYAQDGLLTRTVLAHGAVLQQTWDAHRPLLTNWSASQNGTLLQEMTYKHDREGNITEMTRPQAGLASYAYDNLYRLTGVNYPSGNLSGRAGTLTYGYDLNGNRTQMEHSFGSESWDYHEGTNLMKQAQGSVLANKVYGKDWKGDRTRERSYGTAQGATNQDASWTTSRVSAYNSRSELERHSVYRVGMDTTTAGFAYEEHGKKILNVRAQVNGSDTTWNPELRYGWDGDWVLWDQDTDGMRFYAYLGHRRIAELVPEGNSWKAYAVLTDHLGSVTGMVDSAGLAAEYLIDPYGNLEEYQGRVQTRYLYTGKEWLALLQGYDFGARIYDPVAGMWWGRDAKEQFWSVYASTGGGLNALNSVDPDGWETVVDENYKDTTGTQIDPSDLNTYMQLSTGAFMPITSQEGKQFHWYNLDAESENVHMQWAVAISNKQVQFKHHTSPKFSIREDLKGWLLEAAAGEAFVITSTNCGRHAGRGHYENRAVDVRTWDKRFAIDFSFRLRETAPEKAGLILGPEYYWKASGRTPTPSEYWGHRGTRTHLHIEVRR